jgi:hypothetical protein
MRKEWSYAALALAAGLIGGMVGGRWSNGAAAAAEPARPIETAKPIVAPAKLLAAQRIELVDAKGRTEAAIYTKSGGPSFDLYDHTGKERVGIFVAGDQSLGLRLYDAKGVERVAMMINPDGIPTLRIFDGGATLRTLLGVDNEGEPALDFYSREGRILRELP